MTSSTIMPAPPTTKRRHLLPKAVADDASTYGIGVKTRSITPMSWTSPPYALMAAAWPSSCRALMIGKSRNSASAFSGVVTRSMKFSVSASQCTAMRTRAGTTMASHGTRPSGANSGRNHGSSRRSSGSGSRTWKRQESGLSHWLISCRRDICWPRRSSSAVSGGTSHCSTSAECSWLSNKISSSWVGASSPSCATARSQRSCTVRRPSMRPMSA